MGSNLALCTTTQPFVENSIGAPVHLMDITCGNKPWRRKRRMRQVCMRHDTELMTMLFGMSADKSLQLRELYSN